MRLTSKSAPASHRLSEITSSWAHLLKMPFGRSECLLMMWDKKDSNLAHINSPSPDGVLVADHIKWFSQGFIHSVRFLHSFSLLILVRTLWISIKENMLIYNHCIKSGWGRCNFLKPLFAKNFFQKLTFGDARGWSSVLCGQGFPAYILQRMSVDQ